MTEVSRLRGVDYICTIVRARLRIFRARERRRNRVRALLSGPNQSSSSANDSLLPSYMDVGYGRQLHVLVPMLQ